MEEKARQEGMDAEQRRKDIVMGVVIGGAVVGVPLIIMAVVMGIL